MHVSVLGSLDQSGFPEGWKEEKVLSVLGSVKIDLTERPPGEGAHLTATSIVGSIVVVASPGTRVALDGVSVIGSRKQNVRPGDGPEVRITANTFFGSVEVREPKGT